MSYEKDQAVEVNLAPKRGLPQEPAPDQWVPSTVVVDHGDRVIVRLESGRRLIVLPEKVRVP